MHPESKTTIKQTGMTIPMRRNDGPNFIAPPSSPTSSSPALSTGYNPNRSKNNCHVKSEGHVLQVKQVVFELVKSILGAGTIGVLDLCPSRDSGAHGMPFIVIRNRLP